MKRLTAVIAAITLAFGGAAVSADSYGEIPNEKTAFGEADDSSEATEQAEIKNEYIKLLVEKGTGSYSLFTTAGNPDLDTDDDANLTYDRVDYKTSRTTIFVDGNINILRMIGSTEQKIGEDGKSVENYYSYKGVDIIQKISFIKSPSTGREDCFEIKYTLTNNDEVSHEVGTRIMIDTMLGTNDDAKFRIPGVGEITNETLFEGDAIPQYWQVFDNIEEPGVVAQGTFFRSEEQRPDIVQFVAYGHVFGFGGRDSWWSYTADPDYKIGDSAVTIKWNERELDPGESRTYSTYYGVSELASVTGDIDLAMSCDREVEQSGTDENGYPVYPELPVIAYVDNKMTADLENAYIRIELPEGFSISENSANKEEISYPLEDGSIPAESSFQTWWKLNIAGDIVPGDYEIKMYVGGDGAEEKCVTRTVTVIGELPAPDSSVIDSSETDSSTPDSSIADSSTADSSSASGVSSSQTSTSQVSSSQASSSKANSSSSKAADSNPATGGIAGAGAVLATVLAAGLVVSRKNKRK